MAAALPNNPRLITFDTYGTLIDWDSAFRAYLAELVDREGWHLNVSEFHATWYQDHVLPALFEPFVPYRELLYSTMEKALAEVGISTEGLVEALDKLGDVMASAPPFADSVETLRQLGRHVPLATISNSERDLIEVSAASLGNPFGFALTADAVEAYKPHPALFELVLARAGVEPHEAVHVAQSQFVDLPCSVPMGMPTVWINRQGQELRPGTPAPTFELANLVGLPSLLGLDGDPDHTDADAEGG